jgi:hypothetical protein
VAAFAFVADGEAAVAEQPGDGPLDLPPVPSQPLGRLDARTRDPRGDAPSAQPGQGLGGVVGLVRAQLARAPAPWPAPGPDRRDRLDQRPQRVNVMDVGGRDPDGERDALRVGQNVQLAAGLAPVDRVRAGQ